jgi:GNAT superfamily N-acetyltransferase
MSELEIQRSPSDADIDELRKSLIGYNVAHHGFTETFDAAIFIRNEEGVLEAGVSARGWGGTCEVELLWVAEHRRGDGLGTRMMAAIEEEALRVGCNKIILDTFSYQAPDFYKKLGFEITSTIEDFPEGHTHYLLVKRLTS